MTDLKQEKNEIIALLQQAMIFELSTIPAYMTALISIKKEHNRVPADIIRSVMMEEMLHMCLVGNILSALGGRVEFNADNIPSYPLTLTFEGRAFKNREFEVNLAPMTSKNIFTFTRIEQPDDLEDQDKRLEATAEITVPGYTVGAFYAMIDNKLTALCAKYSDAEVFDGRPAIRQVNVNFYWSGGGQPITVTNISQAQEAIRVIVEQGEGAPSSVLDGDDHYFEQRSEVAHFFRFNEILYGRFYQPNDPPREPPSGAQFEVDYDAVFPIKVNAKSCDYAHDPHMAYLNEEFNRQYCTMLVQLAEAFNGEPESLYSATLNGMHEMVEIARRMVSTPIKTTEGQNGAPSFEWVDPLGG